MFESMFIYMFESMFIYMFESMNACLRACYIVIYMFESKNENMFEYTVGIEENGKGEQK